MGIDLYYVPGSAPCCAVRFVAATAGIDLNLKLTNLMAQEQLKPEFVKMNPQHTVPTLDDQGFYLWESRAICTYLIEQYAKDDSLYPKDPKKRAIVNQRLYFDNSLYATFADYFYPQIFGGAPADAAKLQKIHDSVAFLEKFLEGQEYAAGKTLSIADLCLSTSYAYIELAEVDLSKYKNCQRWFARIKSEAPKYEETSGAGLKAFTELINQLKKK